MRPVFSKILYAVLLSSLQPDEASSVGRPSVGNSYRSRYNRAISIVHLVDRVIPGVANRLSRSIYNNSFFPWEPVSSELIARGSGAAVFKLNWGNGAKVLRIYRRSLGHSTDRLLRVAAYYKNRYRILLNWYGGPLNLMPPIDFLVLRGPRLVGSVAASLQPYIHGQKQDLFEDFTDDELLQLLREKPFVRGQFLFFARQILRQWKEEKMCLDILGNQNVMLVNQGGTFRLCLPDVGIFEFETLIRRHPKRIPEIEKRMDRLAHLFRLTNEL